MAASTSPGYGTRGLTLKPLAEHIWFCTRDRWSNSGIGFRRVSVLSLKRCCPTNAYPSRKQSVEDLDHL